MEKKLTVLNGLINYCDERIKQSKERVLTESKDIEFLMVYEHMRSILIKMLPAEREQLRQAFLSGDTDSIWNNATYSRSKGEPDFDKWYEDTYITAETEKKEDLPSAFAAIKNDMQNRNINEEEQNRIMETLVFLAERMNKDKEDTV